MDRRETLKTLLVGTVAGATLSASGCRQSEDDPAIITGDTSLYGRTPSEKEWDEKIISETFFNVHEMTTIATLCDIILPASDSAGSANDAGVPDFVEFIVKDLPDNQLPLRGGIMWLDGEAQKRYNRLFTDCSDSEQISIIDDIAYPDAESKKPDMGPGIKFFDRMRNLTLTGYYTTRMGLNDLGYKGNLPFAWDGIPDEVLAEHDVDYDPDWIAKCIDQAKREIIAEWDAEGNLLT